MIDYCKRIFLEVKDVTLNFTIPWVLSVFFMAFLILLLKRILELLF